MKLPKQRCRSRRGPRTEPGHFDMKTEEEEGKAKEMQEKPLKSGKTQVCGCLAKQMKNVFQGEKIIEQNSADASNKMRMKN